MNRFLCHGLVQAALYLFTFGSLAVHANPPLDTWEEVVDDGLPGYSETGNAWRSWPFYPAVGGSYRYLSHYDEGRPRRGTATWQVSIPADGRYEVSVSFRRTENRTSDADYRIVDGEGMEHRHVVDQRANPTSNDLTWYQLGEFDWKANQTAAVILDGTDDNQSDEADAVRWELVEKKEKPDTSSNNIAPVLQLLLDGTP